MMTRPVTSMPRCRPTLCRSWWTTGSRRQLNAAARGAVAVRAHQYLTRGSMRAAMMSTMKLVTRDDHGEQGDDALHGDEVARLEVLDELEAEALPLEGGLGQHGAAEQQRDLQPDDRDDRDQRRLVARACGPAGTR